MRIGTAWSGASAIQVVVELPYWLLMAANACSSCAELRTSNRTQGGTGSGLVAVATHVKAVSKIEALCEA